MSARSDWRATEPDHVRPRPGNAKVDATAEGSASLRSHGVSVMCRRFVRGDEAVLLTSGVEILAGNDT